MIGRRIYPDKGDSFKPGDYGIEKGEWQCRTPDSNIGLGSLTNHEVIEHDDGTITVSPSILITGKASWHGYLKEGIWTEA